MVIASTLTKSISLVVLHLRFYKESTIHAYLYSFVIKICDPKIIQNRK